jgi:DNA-binding response OmpR family regulator
MSGYGDVEVMERFSGARIDDFLPKPFSPDQLAAKVRDVLEAVAEGTDPQPAAGDTAASSPVQTR